MPPSPQREEGLDDLGTRPSAVSTVTVDSRPPLTIDDIYDLAGGFGTYQVYATVFGVLTSFVTGQHVMSGYFATLEHSLECRPDTVCVGDGPSMADYCAALDAPMGSSNRSALVNYTLAGRAEGVTHDLGGCAPEAWMAPLTGSMFFVGWFLGGFSAGALCDKIGRLRTSYICLVASCVVNAAAIISTSMYMYYAFKVGQGAFTGGLALASYVYTVESMPVKYQGWIGTLVLASFSFGCAALVPMAYFVPQWKTFTLMVSVPNLASAVFIFLIVESPRWVASANGIFSPELAKTMTRICSANGVATAPMIDELDAAAARKATVSESAGPGAASTTAESKQQPSACQLLMIVYCAFAELRKRTLIMNFFWFTCAFTYYGLNYAAGDLGGDLYFNAFVIVIIEVPAYLLCAWAQDHPRLGRKQTSFYSFVVTAVCCVMVAFVGGDGKRYIGFIGKFGITIAFTVAYIWAGEVFSTDIRSTAMGTATSAARVGGLLAPLVSAAGMATAGPIYGAAAAAVAVLCLFLPETLGRDLPETVDDLQTRRPSTLQELSNVRGKAEAHAPLSEGGSDLSRSMTTAEEMQIDGEV